MLALRPPEQQSDDEQGNAHHLRRGEQIAEQERTARVVTQELQPEANHRVEQQVAGKNLSVELPPLPQPHQGEK